RDPRTDDLDGIRTPGISGRAAAVLLLTAEAATVRRTRPAIDVCVHTPAHVEIRRRKRRTKRKGERREAERESGARDVLGPGSLHVAQGRLDVPTDTTMEEAMTYGPRNLPLTVHRTLIPFRCNMHASRTIPAQNSDSCINNHGTVLVGRDQERMSEIVREEECGGG
ncbi:hypothetical protein ALC60_13437, partial [Trachymyrmex zeteki]